MKCLEWPACLPLAVAGVLGLVPSLANAQTSNEGNNLVSFTIASSISLTFQSDASGVTLTGSGTNTATLAFGDISPYGTISTPGVTRTVGASDFTVSSPFVAGMQKANTSSATYRLAVALASADPTNTWQVNAVTLTTASQSLGSTFACGNAAHTLYLTLPLSSSGGAISKVLNFTAVAN